MYQIPGRSTLMWSCGFCSLGRMFLSEETLWGHTELDHEAPLAFAGTGKTLGEFKRAYLEECKQRKPTKDDFSPRKPTYHESNVAQTDPSPRQDKRPLSSPTAGPRSLSGLGNIRTPQGSQDVDMRDLTPEGQATTEPPNKRAALGNGISAGSANPYHESSASPLPLRRASGQDSGNEKDIIEARPKTLTRQLGTANLAILPMPSVDHTNVASTQRSRALRSVQRKLTNQASQNAKDGATILGRNASFQSLPVRDDNYDIIMQPETRLISQEQLVAEVKGIYAGLVMVEAKCIEVDNKQATLAQADPTSQPKLNNEQWQALIALHRTLLYEHHDFFLASQHPSASPALRRLASKYAMPARMWRHGIHSFLELLRHRLPASLDHTLAFIYLAYSMMALLYETVPAFEDTWIECLGDLGRYRMAIEDDDLRDREVWTGVARHWYSKASDKAPTTGRLYHHLAILARPNALQQLFYYAKSLCVVIPFTSARESILTLFEPVLNPGSNSTHGQYRLPPFDEAFVKAHGLLFTNGDVEQFEAVVNDFVDLLNEHIHRVGRKFMEQGYYIAIANSVAMLAFASKDNPVVQAMTENPALESDVVIAGDDSHAVGSFQRAKYLSIETLEIVLGRTDDPNVLPFIHATMVFMYHLARHPAAMKLLETSFPWEPLIAVLNTLITPYRKLTSISASTVKGLQEVLSQLPQFPMAGIASTANIFESEGWGQIKDELFPDFKCSDWTEKTRGCVDLESSERERWSEMMSEYPARKIHTGWGKYVREWKITIRLENNESWKLLPVWTKSSATIRKVCTIVDGETGSVTVDVVHVKTWTEVMDEMRYKFQNSHWAKITKERMEEAVRLEVGRIQAEITKDFSAVADFTTVRLTDIDMDLIVMRKLRGEEKRKWPEFIHWKARQILELTLQQVSFEVRLLKRFVHTDFPLPIKDDLRPFPEDFAMRGLPWADGHHPEAWFENDKIDDEEKYLEVASMTDDRKERILWLACRTASLGDWIKYDSESRMFSTSSVKTESTVT
ncbi:hypothetical protein DL98DRAFT_578007 [Cadophora sp. DSE1049]|nr:hypothetical protein DL98DRAFT_578007 [Cadophora sp. DSE1049]